MGITGKDTSLTSHSLPLKTSAPFSFFPLSNRLGITEADAKPVKDFQDYVDCPRRDFAQRRNPEEAP